MTAVCSGIVLVGLGAMALPCCALGDLTHLTNPYVANILRSTPYILASHDLGKKCAVLCTNLVNYLMDSTSPLAHHLGWNPHAGTEDVPASNHVIQTAIEDVSSGVTWPITAHRHIWWFQWFPKKITTTKNEFQTTNHSFMIHIVSLCCVSRFEGVMSLTNPCVSLDPR